jgi:hypothetical protein
MTTGAVMMQDNVHAIIQIVFFESYFLGWLPPSKKVEPVNIDFFIRINKRYLQ